jgi:putative tryptophan/tyrosine transport system substrate-binding protein
MVPTIRRLAIMANASGFPGSLVEMREVQAKGVTLGLDVITPEVRRAEDIPSAFDTIRGHTDALYVVIEPTLLTNRGRISALAFGDSLPAIYPIREFVEAGGLMSYGPNYREAFRRTAELVDKILRGTKPREIPVEQPSKFELVINLKSARAFNLNVPPQLLARADEVIE